MTSKATLVALCALLCASSACALTYSAALNGAGDGVATGGEAMFAATCTASSCSYNLTLMDLTDVYQAHLHQGNSSVADGPVVVFLLQPVMPYITFDGMGVVSGTFNSTAFVGPYANMPFSTLTSAMAKGGVYANVHTKAYPNGEVRGQTATM